VIARRLLAALAGAALLLVLPAVAVLAAERPIVTWHPAKPRLGEVAWVLVRGAGDGATIEGALGSRSLAFFPYAGGHAAVAGIDLESKPGAEAWRLAIVEPGARPRTLTGKVTIQPREFPVQRLTLPPGMVDLDPLTERRAISEGDRLRTLYRSITAERFWRGRFVRPVAGEAPGTGFGARRIINGKPRSPHSGIDYAVERGTPVVASNSGRVALVADFFFPGRLVVVDHGLGLYTLYFHLDSVAVTDGEMVDRGQLLGTVGATGRATGPHLHFGAQLGAARIDPEALLSLQVND
jgi:murein DD-endopeptidase MepM/ murein hydrolase activator NlpD